MGQDLEDEIRQQVEFYFGDQNYPKDKFLQEQVAKNDGWMPLQGIMRFKKMQTICKDERVVVQALLASKNGIVQVSECHKKLRRNPDLPLPAKPERAPFPREERVRNMEEMNRTVYVKNLAPEVTDELLFELFLQMGPLEKARAVPDSDYGFITFKHAKSVEYSMKMLNQVRLFDKPLLVKPRGGSDTERQLNEKKAQQDREEYLNSMRQSDRRGRRGGAGPEFGSSPASGHVGFPPHGHGHQPEFHLQPPHFMQNNGAMFIPTAHYLPEREMMPNGSPRFPHLPPPPLVPSAFHPNPYQDFGAPGPHGSPQGFGPPGHHASPQHGFGGLAPPPPDIHMSPHGRSGGEESYDELFAKHRRSSSRHAGDPSDRDRSGRRRNDRSDGRDRSFDRDRSRSRDDSRRRDDRRWNSRR